MATDRDEMERRRFLSLMGGAGTGAVGGLAATGRGAAAAAPDVGDRPHDSHGSRRAQYDVLAFGARGDGTSQDTRAVQKAIDACADRGGGTVYFAPGTYLCGSLHLRTGVTLHLDAGATVRGSEDNNDYDQYETLGFRNDADDETSYFHHALIWGEDLTHIGIVGRGVVDGNRQKRGGPKPIALKRCRFVAIQGIQIVNAPNYCISLLGTDDVQIDGVTIRNAFCDGIDPDSCRNVRISNCHIESADDAIVPKASYSLGRRRSVENLTVTNCYLATCANCFKLGTESGGDFKRIALSNCVMTRLQGHRPAISGIALESVDGSNLDGVVVSNITMVDVRAPVFVRLGNRGRDLAEPIPGTLRNVSISHVVATNASLACSITGITGHPVEGISLSDLRISYHGGGPYRAPNEPVPEVAAAYPDPRIFGGLSAYGIYCRHVADLTLANVHLTFEDRYWRLATGASRSKRWATDRGVPACSTPGRAGNALVCDDVSRLNIANLRARPAAEGDALIRLVDVAGALVQGCLAPEKTAVFLEVAGRRTKSIGVLSNDLRHADQAVILVAAPAQEVVRLANAERPGAAGQ